MNVSRALNKYYVLTFITLTLLIGCADNEEKVHKKNINQDIRKVSSKILKSGPETRKIFFDSGILKAELTYLNDKLEGESKEYCQNGKLKSERFYRNGRAITETRKKYYASGALLTVTNFKHGKLHGICRTYFENGQLQDETHFEAGEQIGASLNFYINGQIYSDCEQPEGTDEEICRTYYPNGNVQSHKLIKGGGTALRQEFYNDGQLRSEINFIDDSGYAQERYKTGTLRREIFRNDQITTVKKYDENGQLMEVINYKENKKQVDSKFFDENGDLTLEQIWKDGELIEEIFYE